MNNKYIHGAVIAVAWSLTGAIAGLTAFPNLEWWDGAIIGAVAAGARQVHSMLPTPAGNNN